MIRKLASVCAAAALFTSPISARRPNGENVTVRSYNIYGVTAPHMRTAQQVVNALLSDVGIQADWRHCRIAGRRSTNRADPCSDPVRSNELVVRKAIFMIGRLGRGNDQAINALIEKLGHTSPQVRLDALYALDKIASGGSQAAVDRIGEHSGAASSHLCIQGTARCRTRDGDAGRRRRIESLRI